MMMLNLEPTKENLEFAEEFNDLCMDYAHHHIDDDEFEEKLNELLTRHS